MICLGIDGGGTTTRAVVVRFGNTIPQVLGSGSASSSNHYSVGIKVATQNIARAVDEALNAAHLAKTEIAAWGLGLAGACTHDEQTLWHRQLNDLTGDACCVVDEDVAAAHAGAFARDDNAARTGVVCIAGTGANSFGIGANGKRARADGWGPLLGDRGSGYSIGEAALRATCALLDGALPDDALPKSHAHSSSLPDRVLDHFDVHTIDALLPLVYATTFAKDQIAALVPSVAQCANSGDNLSREILTRAGRDLAASCAAVMKALDTCRVAPYGSILQNVETVRATFERELSSRHSDLEIVAPRHDAAIGAALLALDAAQKRDRHRVLDVDRK